MSNSINPENAVEEKSFPDTWYDSSCQKCPRLTALLVQVSNEHPQYFCKPVPPFGDPSTRLLVVGLVPGKHGANATGCPFTGDYARVLLYRTLFKFSYANKPTSEHANDSLELKNCQTTNAVKCLLPDNKPVADEAKNCNIFLSSELLDPKIGIVLALGQIAHCAALHAYGLKLSAYKFGHNRVFWLKNGICLVDSYHCSRYNTQTDRRYVFRSFPYYPESLGR